MEKTRLLIELAKRGAMYKENVFSTSALSQNFNASQQTISRNLIEIEKKGLIERLPTTKGIGVRLTEEGRRSLNQTYNELKDIFREELNILKGSIESGLGEGAYYISLGPYKKDIEQKLGIMPYAGTLNIRIDYTEFLQFIVNQEKIRIDGFKSGSRTFGDIVAYRVWIEKEKAAIIIPERTSHERDVIEIIAEENLREKLKLKDNDTVRIKAR